MEETADHLTADMLSSGLFLQARCGLQEDELLNLWSSLKASVVFVTHDLEEAISLADRIAANAPLAVRYSKSVMKQAAEVSEAEGWKINGAAVGVVFTSADAMEGPIAFAEKRPPNWQGK